MSVLAAAEVLRLVLARRAAGPRADGAHRAPRCGAAPWRRRRGRAARHTVCARGARGPAARRARKVLVMRARPPRPSPHRTQVLATRASALRAAATTSEVLLWQALSGEKLGARFRRQVVLGEYIADFVCPSARLVVEVDGGYHAERGPADARRDRALARLGYRVLRVTAEQVTSELPAVVLRILVALG